MPEAEKVKAQPASSSETELDDLLIGYREKNGGVPYFAEWMGLEHYYSDYKEEMNTVDSWLNLELERLGLLPSKAAYIDTLRVLMKGLKFHKHADPHDTLKKLSIFLEKPMKDNRYRKELGLDLLSVQELYDKK